MKLVIPAAIVASLAFIGSAEAQPGRYTPPPGQQYAPGSPYAPAPPQTGPEAHRHGLVLGLGLGLSVGEEGLAVGLRVGYMLSPRWALLGEVTGYIASDDDEFEDFDGGEPKATDLGVVTLGLQTWVSRKLWLRAGLGSAEATLDNGDSLEGVGWVMGAGYELIQRRNFAFDARFEAFGGGFDEGSTGRAAILLGVTWY